MTTSNSGNELTNEEKNTVWNVPNQITLVRLVLSLVLFVTIPLEWYWISLVLFAIAASTDWVDGWYARKYDQVTQLGRMLDPFCDKLIICGTFVCLVEATYPLPYWCRISAVVTVIVIGRELLVTALRSFVESQGGDFSAKMAGKIKMVLQCAVAIVALFVVAYYRPQEGANLPLGILVLLAILVWATVISTVHSGAGYIFAAIRFAGKS